MGKLKKPGRVKLICHKCEADFSTHSSNRTMCHKCRPKCTERHFFTNQKIQAGKVDKNLEENKIELNLKEDKELV